MKSQLEGDTYESTNFALQAVGDKQYGFLNINLAGLRMSKKNLETSTYENGVWITVHDDMLDELITALQYYKQYRTFKKEA